MQMQMQMQKKMLTKLWSKGFPSFPFWQKNFMAYGTSKHALPSMLDKSNLSSKLIFVEQRRSFLFTIAFLPNLLSIIETMIPVICLEHITSPSKNQYLRSMIETEAYLEPTSTSTMKHFGKNS